MKIRGHFLTGPGFIEMKGDAMLLIEVMWQLCKLESGNSANWKVASNYQQQNLSVAVINFQ
jgi:hypothetical protein